MKTLITAVLLLATTNAFANLGTTVSGNTINWPDTGGWMQVQNSSYSTVCEGFIATCLSGTGSFVVIDHSSGIREDNVVVSGGSSPISPPATQIVTEGCINLVRSPGMSYQCTATCPTGMSVISVLSCIVNRDAAEGATMGSGFITRGDWTRCESDDDPQYRTVSIEVSVICQ